MHTSTSCLVSAFLYIHLRLRCGCCFAFIERTMDLSSINVELASVVGESVLLAWENTVRSLCCGHSILLKFAGMHTGARSRVPRV